MADEIFVGYETQLRQIAVELQSRAPVSPTAALPIQLFNVNGPAGSGKRTLIKRLWAQVSTGEVPRILFTINPAETDDIAERLLADAKTNRSYLDDTLEKITTELQGQAKRLEDAGRPLPPEARLTLLSEMIEQRLIDDPSNGHNLQILFALPELLALPQPQRETIARLLPRGTTNVDCRVIVTTPSPGSQDDLTKLFPERVPVGDVPLPILSPEEVEAWILGKKIAQEFAAAIYQRSGGLPGRLEHCALEVMRERQERMLTLMAEDALTGLDDNQKQLLCLAVLLPDVNQVTLRVLMSAEDAQATMQLVRHSDWPESGWQDTSFIVGKQIRQALIKYLEAHYPQAARKAAPQAEQFAQIHTLIPTSAQREALARLSAFNYFNDSLLREVMPTVADATMRIVQETPGYFENSGSNFKLKPEVRQAVESYIKMVDYTIPDEDRAKIAASWDARRRKIMDLIVTSEAKAKRETDSLNLVQVQIKQLSVSIDGELDRINRMRRKSQRKTRSQNESSAAGHGMQIGRLAMQIAGFVIIYLSFLFYSRTTLIYAAVGVGLILGALFVKGGVLAHASAASSDDAPASPVDIDKHEKNLHFLNIKRGQLESRQNIVASSIAREKTALKEFDKQLREPYS